MQLTLALLKRKYPRGNIFLGKYRLTKKVQGYDYWNARRDLDREHLNMLYLRNPYISIDEYKGMSKKLQVHEKWMDKWITERIKRFKRTTERRTLDNHLNLLKIGDRWE